MRRVIALQRYSEDEQPATARQGSREKQLENATSPSEVTPLMKGTFQLVFVVLLVASHVARLVYMFPRMKSSFAVHSFVAGVSVT